MRKKNGVDARLEILKSSQTPSIQADILLANILAGTLIKLESTLASQVKKGGRIVLSGILSDQAGEVSHAFRTHFDMLPPEEQEGWVLLQGVRITG